MNFLKKLYESKEALYKLSKNTRFFSGNVLVHQKLSIAKSYLKGRNFSLFLE